MTSPAARIPPDQVPTGADGMIVCDRPARIYSGKGIEVQALRVSSSSRMAQVSTEDRAVLGRWPPEPPPGTLLSLSLIFTLNLRGYMVPR